VNTNSYILYKNIKPLITPPPKNHPWRIGAIGRQ